MDYTKHSIDFINAITNEKKNSWKEWNMIPNGSLVINPPEVKTSSEDVPGADGTLDLTETLANRPLYDNRTGSWDFIIIKDLSNDKLTHIKWNEIYSEIANFLHGKLMKIVFDDDHDYYYQGRLQISSFESNGHYHKISIDYDVFPYKKTKETYDESLTVDGSNSISIEGSPMPCIPDIWIHSSQYILGPDDAITRGEAVALLYNAASYLGSSQTHSATTTSFADVLSHKAYYDAVCWGEEKNYISGYTDSLFGAENSCTRAQFLTMLYAVKGKPTAAGNIPFTDVPTASYYYNAVRWAFKNGFVVGDGNKKFNPNNAITRAQAVYIIWLAAGKPTASSTTDFIDLKDGDVTKPWYFQAVAYCKDKGYASGYDDGSFRPGNYITRGAFIQMLYALAGKPAKSSSVWKWSDDSHFTDISTSIYCHDAVYWAWSNNIASGTSSTTFTPGRVVYRKEAVAMLFKFGQIYAANFTSDLKVYTTAGDEDNDDASLNGYEEASDVAKTAYYYNAVCWAIVNGFTTLDTGYMFNPEGKMTRAMNAQMIYRLSQKITQDYSEPTYSNPFTDVIAYYRYYINACQWAASAAVLMSQNKSGMTVKLENDKIGAVSVYMESGVNTDPRLVMDEHNNVFTFTGKGSAEVIFERGSL